MQTAASDKHNPSIERLLVVHEAPLPLPKGWARRVRMVADRAGWPPSEPGDVVIWGAAPESLRVEGLPPGARLWSPSPAVIGAAREVGWGEVLLLPDLAADTLLAAFEERMVALDKATLLPHRGEIWIEGRVIRLPPRERELLAALAASPGPVPRERLLAGGSVEALEATLARLRRRVGLPVIQSDGRAGWRLLTPSPPLQPAPVAPAAAPQAARVEGKLVPLTAREAALFDLLMRSPGETLRREVARAAIGLDDAALDTVAHRLRRRLGAQRLRTVRGVGWRLDMPPGSLPAPPSAPLLLQVETIEEMVRAHTLVTVVGSAGRELVVSLAHERRWASFDVRGLAIERVLRWVERRGDQVVLEGFDDPSPWASALAGLASEGRRLLVSAASPIGHPAEVVLASGSLQDAAAAAAMALARDPDLARSLAVLAAFEGPFDGEDVRALCEGFDPDAAAREGLLQLRGGAWRIPSAARAALSEAVDRDRWALWVVQSFARDLGRRALQKERLLERIPDLARAARHLVAQRSGAGVRATVLWGHFGRWVGSAPSTDDVLAALSIADDDEDRALLMLAAAQSDGVDQSSIVDLAGRAAQIAKTSDTRWQARLAAANQHDDRSDPSSRPHATALFAAADDPSDPAPADVRGMLAILAAHGLSREEDRVALLTDALLKLEVRRWSPGEPVSGVWLDEIRTTLLSMLAEAFLSLGNPDYAEAALLEGLRIASPDTASVMELTRAMMLARTDRWLEADRSLDALCWAPVIRAMPMSHARVLGWRALLAALHGPRALAVALADQLDAVLWQTGAAFVERQLHQVRAWIALDDGDMAALERHAAEGFPGKGGELLLTAARYMAGDGELQQLSELLQVATRTDNHGARLAFLRRIPELRVDRSRDLSGR